MEKYILAVDMGTQSIRVALISPEGEVHGWAEKKYETPYLVPQYGWAEVEEDFYINSFIEVVKELVDKNKDKVDSIIALSVVTIRDTIVFLKDENKGKGEKPNYKTTYNIIHWADQRSASRSFCKFPLWMRISLNILGLFDAVTRISTLGRTNWMKEHRPDIWEQTEKVCLLSAYVNYRLTGNLVETRSCLLGHLPFNSKRGEWDKKGSVHYHVFPMNMKMLPPLINQNESVGFLSREIAEKTGLKEGLKVYSPGTDKGLEQIGQGAISSNELSMSFGSAATVELVSKHYFEPERFIPEYRSALPSMYTPDYQVYRGYWMISWFARQFAWESERKAAEERGESIEAMFEKMLEKTPPLNDGLYILPFWGEGIKTVGARGAIIGFNDIHSRSHLYRAMIEGINYELYDGYLRMLKRGKLAKPNRICLSSGGSRSNKVCQITADMFGLPVHRGKVEDASILGAAIAGFVYEKEFDSFKTACESMVKDKDVFVPNSENHKKYLDFYHKIYKGTLKVLYTRMNKINKMFLG